ncbi:unnamed protein product, partial [Timema podura]|nr:unnamed protein product [Timema podura]
MVSHSPSIQMWVGFLQTVSTETLPDEDEDHQAVKKQLSELLAQLPLSTMVNGHSTTSGGLKPGPPYSSSVSTSPRRGGAGLLGKVVKPRTLSSMSAPLQTSMSSDGSHSAEEGTGEEDGERSANHDIVLVVPFNPSGGENI